MNTEFKLSFSNEETIFQKGEHGDRAFIIDSGRVEVSLMDGELHTPLAILGTGEIFGEMVLVDGSPRSASTRALGQCNLTSVSTILKLTKPLSIKRIEIIKQPL